MCKDCLGVPTQQLHAVSCKQTCSSYHQSLNSSTQPLTCNACAVPHCCCSAATKEDMAAHHALFINTLKVTPSTHGRIALVPCSAPR
jgi:hypothetical protein